MRTRCPAGMVPIIVRIVEEVMSIYSIDFDRGEVLL